MTDSMLRYRVPIYERKHSYFWFNGHMSWYNYIMDDFGNIVQRTYPYHLYENTDWLQFPTEIDYLYQLKNQGHMQ